MRRKFNSYFLRSAVTNMYYVPMILMKMKNWLSFLLNNIGLKETAERYAFRNGVVLQTSSGVDASTIHVVFFKKDYGAIPSNSTIIDIGANIGTYSVFAASSFRNNVIYAYEPMPDNYSLLKENIKDNAMQDQVHTFNKGVAGENGVEKLYIADGSPYHSIFPSKDDNQYFEMSCCTLKDIFIENHIDRCDLLKIDCEGAEFEIFYNTPKKYLEKINSIRMEYHNRNNENYNIESLKTFLKEHGFKMVYQNTNALIAWFAK